MEEGEDGRGLLLPMCFSHDLVCFCSKSVQGVIRYSRVAIGMTGSSRQLASNYTVNNLQKCIIANEFCISCEVHTLWVYQRLIADPVIKAIARLEFEDGSPPWRLLVSLWWPHLAQDQFCTTRGCGLVMGAVWLS